MRTIWLSLLIGPLFAACADKPLDMSKPVYVTVSTAMGDVTVELYGDTPLHRDNFIRLCRSGAYDGVLFHRVIEGFVVQGGDPDSRKREPGVLYGGNDGGYTVPAEIRSGHFNKRGALIDAKAGDETNPERASAGTQFCFVQGRRMTDEELDEAEKQISYEENYEIIIKLSNYILPISLIAIFLVGIAFHTDILLALVVVSLIYVYILVSQYKITKRYYKE